MKKELKYIERIDGDASHRGPAWIGFVTASRTGRTLYFNGHALQRIPRGGVVGNHADLESGQEYWVSGVKARDRNRHWAGGGKTLVERAALAEFLAIKGWTELYAPEYEVTDDIVDTDIAQFAAMLNGTA